MKLATFLIGAAAMALAWALGAFVVGVVQAARGSWLVRRQAAVPQTRPLVVVGRADHGAYFQLWLRPAGVWARWLRPRVRGGQYLTLHPLIDGQRHSRRYSLAGLPRWQAGGWVYALAIKREPGGLVSNALAQQLTLGARIAALPPEGQFVWPAVLEGEQLLVAGGIGITPMRCMLHEWQRRGSPVLLTLLWSVRQPDEWMDYLSEFQHLARTEPGFKFVPVFTGTDPQWPGETGRLSAQRLQAFSQTGQPHAVWMCASSPMMDGLTAQCLALGMPREHIHFEAFAAPANTDTQSYPVEVLATGQSLAFCGQPSLLAALTAHAVAIAHDCRNGSCGACLLTVCAGEVRQVIAPEFRTPQGKVLACCVVPAGPLQIRV